MPVPTARFVLVAALAGLAAFVVPGSVFQRLVIINAVLVGIGLVDWLLAPRRSAFRIERRLPPVVVLGGDEPLSWRVTTTLRRSFHISVADELAPSLGADRRFAGTVPGLGSLEAETRIRPRRRGDFRPTRLDWRTRGPLGLVSRQGRTEIPSSLRVHPAFRSKAEAELRIDRARILEVGLRSAKGRGGGTDFDQLREYTVDDESRRIDWAATARVGRPIVRTYRAERNQNVVVLFDNGRVMAGRVDGVPRAEFAMDAALLITTVATRLGDRCGLLAFDHRVRATVPPSHGRDQVSRVTDALYRLEPSLVDSDYEGAFLQTMVTFRRRALIVILTDLIEQAVVESLLPALPVLTRSHIIIVGAVQDPEVRAWADATADDDESVYRQASAARTLRSRRRAAAALRAAGATVVDVPPSRLAAELGDAYLEAKATGRL